MVIATRILHRIQINPTLLVSRHFGTATALLLPKESTPGADSDGGKPTTNAAHDGEKGAMSRRLAQMTEEGLESGSRSTRKIVTEAVFDADLKKQLEERIASASPRQDLQRAFSEADLPTSTGRGTRDIAGAQPWFGNEAPEDAALRMLQDAHKPLKLKGSGSQPAAVSLPRPSRGRVSAGDRLASARDKTAVYSSLKDSGMSPEEREAYFKEVKARFQPTAREVPATLSGLASLANERIEEAIARGQFRNLPRGKVLERDHNASSPWIDTTEYLMNKMIQKQDIVPPWIEKQQEVTAAARRFRKRLRTDWKRHAARVIASAGGSLEQQMKRAEEYAAAEAAYNPIPEAATQPESEDEHKSGISLSGQLQPARGYDVAGTPLGSKSSVQAKRGPFRDGNWEATERAFHKLTVENLNSMTRSYNLIAPQIAQRPYFNLERELKACFAEVAPLLREEIRQRALAPKIKFEFPALGTASAGILDRFDKSKAKVYDEDQKKQYSFRQFWRDIWKREVAG